MSFIPSSPQANTLADLIKLWVFSAPPPNTIGAQILDHFLAHIRRVIARYPDAYFPLGRRSEDAAHELNHDLFYRCDRHKYRRPPYEGRTPFRTFAEEDASTTLVLRLTVYGRLAILRELLRANYDRSLRRDPNVRLDAERFAAIRRVMRARCAMSTNSTSGVLRYLPIPTTLQVVLRGDEIVERLRRRVGEPLEDRVLAVVRWLQEATVEQVHELITAADPLPITSPNDDAPARPIEERAAEIVTSPELIAGVRDAVVRGWARLGPDERRLMRAISSGASYTQLLDDEPSFGSKSGLTRALRRCNTVFEEELRAEGCVSQSADDPKKPAVIACLILDVLDFLPMETP